MSDVRPQKEIRFGCVRATIKHDGTSREHGQHRVAFACRFKERGEWREETTFGPDDLPLLARAAELALAWIYSQPRSEPLDTATEQ